MGKMICTKCGTELPENARSCPLCDSEEPIIYNRFCEVCGAPMAYDDRFCSTCGTEYVMNNLCPYCGYMIEDGDMFCRNCGNKLNESSYYGGERGVGRKPFVHYIAYILGSVVLLVIILGGVYLYRTNFGRNATDNASDSYSAQIAEQNRRVEEERREFLRKEEEKRIEEENKPQNKFNSIIETHDYVWESDGCGQEFRKGERVVMYFYPKTKNSGNFSFVSFSRDYNSWFTYLSGRGTYHFVSDNHITADWYCPMPMRGDPRKEVHLSLESDGESIRMERYLNNGEQVSYIQKRKTQKNPLLKERPYSP